MLWLLGLPVGVFISALLVINFFYVKTELEAVANAHVSSVMRDVDGKLTKHLRRIERLAELIQIYIQEDNLLNEKRMEKLFSGAVGPRERYKLRIAHRHLLIEGILSETDSQLDIIRTSHTAAETYSRYAAIKQQSRGWTQLEFKPDSGKWALSYTLAFRASNDDTDSVITIDVPVETLVHGVGDVVEKEDIKLLFIMERGSKSNVSYLLDSPDRVPQVTVVNPQFIDWLKVQIVVDPSPKVVGSARRLISVKNPSDGRKYLTSYFPAALDKSLSLIILLPEERVYGSIANAKLIEIFIALLAFAGLVVLILLISRTISHPISLLVNKVGQLATGNLRVSFPETDSCIELDYLSKSLNQTVQRLNRYFSELKKATAQNERINSELNIARDIQSALLPKQHDMDIATSFDLHACTLPAKEVGGDFYYFFKVGDSHVGFVVGDVSGKGISAALMMVVCLSYLRAESQNAGEPSRFLERFNQFLIKEETSQAIFVTVFYAVVDIDSGELTYANAGHTAPVLIGGDGLPKLINSSHGPALAIIEDARYTTGKATLSKDDRLFFYTDGITEAYNLQEEEFGEQRLLDFLKQMLQSSTTLSAKDCVQSVIEELSRFTRGCVQFDDVTLMCASWNGAGNPFPPSSTHSKDEALRRATTENNLTDLSSLHRAVIKNDLTGMNQAIEMLTSFCYEQRIRQEITSDLCVALDEFLSNIIKHVRLEANQDIQVQFTQYDGTLRIRLEYEGEAFDPLQVPSPSIKENWQRRRPGGLGIYISRQLTDHISYARHGDKNVLVFEKQIST